MKFLKKFSIAVLLIFIAVTPILWVLAKSVNQTIIKDYLNNQISQLTKQNSRIYGDLSWRLLPRPSLKITDIEIGEKNNKDSYFVKLDNVLFNLKITPLLRGKIVFSEFVVNGFTINIPADSHNNNTLLANKVPANTTPITNRPVGNHGFSANNMAQRFAIERFLLSNGQITLGQQQTKKINFVNLQIGAEQFNLQRKSFPLQLKGKLNMENSDGVLPTKANFTFTGNIALPATLFHTPIISLSDLILTGQLSINDLNLKQFKMKKIDASTELKQGILKLSPLSAILYNGESVGNLSYEHSQKKLIINQTSTNININALLHDLGKDKILQGSIDFALHAQISMKNGSWQDNIIGNGSLTIKDGAIEAVNLDKMIFGTGDLINNIIVNKTPQSQQLVVDNFANLLFTGSTKFKLFTFQYNIQNAKLQTNSLILQTDKLQLTGNSQLDLNTNNLESHLLAKVILLDNNLEKIQQLLGGNFPIYISGPLANPVILPDLKIINALLSTTLLKSVIKKNNKHIQQKLNKMLAKAIN